MPPFAKPNLPFREASGIATPALIGKCCHRIWGAVVVGSVSALAIDVEVATSKASYYPGEQLEVLITVTNPAVLHFSSSLQTLYTLDGVYTPDGGSLAVLTQATTPRTWTNIHDWSAFNISLGRHRVVGSVVGYGTSEADTFTVVPAPTPTGSFLIDFDTIPGTTATVGHLMAYDASGVRFHTREGRACTLQAVGGNSWLGGFDPYPTGFNVGIDLPTQVFAARAKVAGGTGVRLTMIAKNAQGRTLASATSEPITTPWEFAQSLSVQATEPIAALEWWPSEANSLVGIDELALTRAPILSFTVTGTMLHLTWPTMADHNYQIWSSSDLQNWSPEGPPRAGTGRAEASDYSIPASGAHYFRLSQTD